MFLNKLYLIICFSLLPFFVTANMGNQPLVPIKVQLNWHHQFQFAGFYAAIKQGYYADAGLEVTLQEWHPEIDVLEELLSGRVDFAVNFSSVIYEYLQGAPIKLVMSSFQHSPMILLSHQPIVNLNELAGKTIMHHDSLQILSLLARVEGELERVPTTRDLQEFINKEFDLLAAYSTNEPFRLRQQQIPFYIVDPKAFGVQSYGDFMITTQQKAKLRPDIVRKFRQATIKGWNFALDNQAEVVDYILANYPVVKDREALLFEAKATVSYVRTGRVPIGNVEKVNLLATLSSAQQAGLLEGVNLGKDILKYFIFNPDIAPFYTEQELQFLQNNPVVTIAITGRADGTFRQASYQSLVMGYIELIEEKTGILFNFKVGHTKEETFQLVRKGKVDMLAAAVPTTYSKMYMNFTPYYLSFPMVLAARKDQSYVRSYRQLNSYIVAVLKGSWAEEYLKINFPNVQLLAKDTPREVLMAVLDGRANFCSGNLAVINSVIREYGLIGLHIVGSSEEDFNIAMGVRKGNPILFSIISKTLASISEQEHQEIHNDWARLEVYHKADTRVLWQIVAIAGAIGLLLLSILLVFIYQKRRQTEYIKQVHELSYASLIDLKTLRLLWVSDSYVTLTGYAKNELLNIPYLDLIPEKKLSPKRQKILTKIKQGQSWCGVVEGKTKQGKSYYVDITLSPVRGLGGKITTCWATRVDVTDKKRIEQLTIQDELTGLYNRRYFNQVIDKEINRAKRKYHPLSVAMLDLDYFKKINDTYGHQQGDVVLKQVAEVLQKHFHRASDFVFRVGGEEFLILSYFATEAAFKDYLECLCRQIEGLAIENKEAPAKILTVSIGASFWQTEDVPNSSEVYREVDVRLYQAKEQGRNQVVIG